MNGQNQRSNATSQDGRAAVDDWRLGLYRIRCLVRKEMAQIRRDRRILGLLIVAPLLQLLVIGFAATTDIREAAIGIRDLDRSWHSREYVRGIAASGYFKTTPLAGPAASDGDELVAGRVGLVVVLPRGFGADLAAGRAVRVQVLVDGSDSNFGIQGLNYLMKANRRFVAQAGARWRQTAGAAVGGPAVTVESRVWYNPGLVSRRYMVPAILGILLTVVTMIATSMALVKEVEDGTMEQIVVTPLRQGELIVGKLLPFVGIGLAELTLALVLVVSVFQIPLRGSVVTFYAMAGPYLLTTLGLGLLVSTIARNQQQAMLISMFFIMMPSILLSGFAFPVENMPPVIQAVTYAIPLKYFVRILRALFLKGAGWTELWADALTLCGFGIGILWLATLKFRKRLD